MKDMQNDKANLKRSYIIWYKLYNILDKTKLQKRRRDQWFPGVRDGAWDGYDCKRVAWRGSLLW